MSLRVSETSGFLTLDSGEALYVRQYVPDAVRGPAVVIAGPDGEERIWSQRTLVNLARHLAAAGCPVVRFDYRGQGESDGVYEEMDAMSRVLDLAAVHRWTELASTSAPVFIGVRLGANVAARLAARLRATVRLIAIEPFSPVGPMIDELLRKNISHQYLVHKQLLHNRAKLQQQIREGGLVSCSGFLLGMPLTSTIQELEWPADAIPPRWAVLKIAPEGDGTSIIDVAPFWKDGPTYRSCPQALFERVTALVLDGSSPGPSSFGALETRAADGREPVTFDTPAGIAVGTWHPAEAREVAALITNAGPNDRSSPHGLAHRTARFFQQHGVGALRIDGRGAGESGGDDRERQDRPTPEIHKEINGGDHVPAIRAALSWLRARGVQKVIVTGLCGGAVNAMLAAAQETGLEFRMIPLGIPVLHLGALEEVEFPEQVMEQEFSRLKNKLFKPKAIWRFVTFQTDYRVFWKIVRSRLDRWGPRRAETRAPLHPNAIVPMIESWEVLERRGARTTFVFSSFDLLYALFLKHFPALAGGGTLPAGSDLHVLENANHIMSDRATEAELMALYARAVAELATGGRRAARSEA